MMFKAFLLTILAVGILADELTTPSNPAVESVKQKLRDACKQYGKEDKVQDVENAVIAFYDCIKDLVNFQTLNKEIEDAKPNGALDEVFQKYCAKTPQFKTCLHTVMDAALPCFPEEAGTHVTAAKSSANELIDFVCHKDGDRIALFIAEGGPDCFKEKTNEIRTCFETLRSSFPNLDAAKTLSLNEKCGKSDTFSRCVVGALETCTTPTPANMAESLFRYVRKSTPCKDVPQTEQ